MTIIASAVAGGQYHERFFHRLPAITVEAVL
jgi:hypothetical protein